MYFIFFFRGGSRYETSDSLGASSVIRSSGGLSTACSTSFGIVRNLQQIGASLSVTSDRESVVYTLEATSDQMLVFQYWFTCNYYFTA